jgi:hypothetical protein
MTVAHAGYVVQLVVTVVLWHLSQPRLLLSTCFTWLFAVAEPAVPDAYTGCDLFVAVSPWQPPQPIVVVHDIVLNVSDPILPLL